MRHDQRISTAKSRESISDTKKPTSSGNPAPNGREMSHRPSAIATYEIDEKASVRRKLSLTRLFVRRFKKMSDTKAKTFPPQYIRNCSGEAVDARQKVAPGGYMCRD